MRRIPARVAFLAAIPVMLVTAGDSRAQNLPTAARMAISMGVAQSRLTGEDAELYGLDNAITGFYVGITADMGILGQQRVRFGPGARYMSRGYGVEVDDSKTTLKYLEVIAPLIFELPLVGGLSLNVSGGPGIALSMGCTIRTESDGVQRSLDCQNEELFYHSYDFTAFGQGGISFVIPNGTRVLVNAGIDRSLTSIDSSGEGIDFKNQSILFGAQATFPLGRRRR
jgi:hypothetical protein